MSENITQKVSNVEAGDLFGAGLRRILRYFIDHPKKEIYQMELARRVGLSIRPAQLQLLKLTYCGFLISRPTRYRHYYRLNRRWPYLLALRKLLTPKLH